MTRRILLADADAFYVSVARLVDPEGAGRAPLLIVGGSASGRGVVTSASYEARRYGVHSAMPTARAMRLCPGATIVPVPWQACVEKSRQMREVMQRWAPVVEAASQDECYLDLSGTERLYKDEPLAETARRMRDEVLKETQLSVSVGGGTSKVVAKMAAGLAKPGGAPAAPAGPAGGGGSGPGARAGREGFPPGVFIVEPGGEEQFMRRFWLSDIPMVGPKAQLRLARFNLKSVDDALKAGRERLREWLGEREGSWLWDRIHGLDGGVVARSAGAKSISRDETFAADIDDDRELIEELKKLVDRAAGDLREHGYLARTVTVRLRDRDFKDRQASKTLDGPVLSDRAVMRVAKELMARLRAARPVPARLIGVALSSLVREEGPAQLALLDGPAAAAESARDRAVAKVVDRLREKLGDGAIALGRKPSRRRR